MSELTYENPFVHMTELALSVLGIQQVHLWEGDLDRSDQLAVVSKVEGVGELAVYF